MNFKISLIWIAAIAICLVPITLLFRGNPRAVSLGLFVFSGPLVFMFGALGLGGSAYNAPNGLKNAAAILVGIVVAIGVLAVLNFIWIGGPIESRLKWVALGWVTWCFVFLVVVKAASAAGGVKRRAWYEIEKKEMADPNSDYSRIKAMYDRASSPPPPPSPPAQSSQAN